MLRARDGVEATASTRPDSPKALFGPNGARLFVPISSTRLPLFGLTPDAEALAPRPAILTKPSGVSVRSGASRNDSEVAVAACGDAWIVRSLGLVAIKRGLRNAAVVVALSVDSQDVAADDTPRDADLTGEAQGELLSHAQRQQRGRGRRDRDRNS